MEKLLRPYVRTKVLLDIPVVLHEQLKEVARARNCTVNTLVKTTLVKLVVNELYIPGKYQV